MKTLIVSVLATLVLAAAIPARAADAPVTVPAAATGGVRVFIEHEVADYATWRKAYNAFRPMQRKLGVTYQAVYQATDNPNDVIVIHDFASADQAKAFLASDELKAAMQKSGVIKGAPHVTITSRALH